MSGKKTGKAIKRSAHNRFGMELRGEKYSQTLIEIRYPSGARRVEMIEEGDNYEVRRSLTTYADGTQRKSETRVFK